MSSQTTDSLIPNDYLSVVYNEHSKPRTEYPQLLTEHLFRRFSMQKGAKFLEVGCGRGEFLKGFAAQGLDCSGCDLSENAQKFLPGFEVKVADLESQGLPYPDNHFDVLYSKSLLEHLHAPDKYLREALRVLKPGGLCITMVPDWEANYKIYFDDFTHRTPFTTVSLMDIYSICGYAETRVEKFRQLPIVWKYPALRFVCGAIAPFVPVRTTNKFLRWSREIMLLGAAHKPKV